MAEQKNNKGFGALDDLSSDIDEKSSNTKPQTAVKKTTAPKAKKSFPPVRKKNVNAIKKSPAIKRKQRTVRNKRAKSQRSPSNKYNSMPYISKKEWNFLWVAFFVILIIYFSMDDSGTSSNKQETSIGTTYNYSDNNLTSKKDDVISSDNINDDETQSDNTEAATSKIAEVDTIKSSLVVYDFSAKHPSDFYNLPSLDARETISKGWKSMLINPNFGEADYKAAYEYNLQGYEMGHPEGAVNLGNIYEYGLGVTTNYERAKLWYIKALQKGAYHSADAELGMVRVFLKSNAVASFHDKKMLYAYLALARRKVDEYSIWPKDRERFLKQANELEIKVNNLTVVDENIRVEKNQQRNSEKTPNEKIAKNQSFDPSTDTINVTGVQIHREFSNKKPIGSFLISPTGVIVNISEDGSVVVVNRLKQEHLGRIDWASRQDFNPSPDELYSTYEIQSRDSRGFSDLSSYYKGPFLKIKIYLMDGETSIFAVDGLYSPYYNAPLVYRNLFR